MRYSKFLWNIFCDVLLINNVAEYIAIYIFLSDKNVHQKVKAH